MHGLDRGLDLVLVGARMRGAHAGHLRVARDLEALDRATSRSYGVLTSRSSVKIGVASAIWKPTKRSRIWRANSSGGVSGSSSLRSGRSDERDAGAAGVERVEEARGLLSRRSPPKPRRSSIAPMNASNWLVDSTVSMPVRAVASSAAEQPPGPVLRAPGFVLDEQDLAPRRVARHQHEDRVVLRRCRSGSTGCCPGGTRSRRRASSSCGRRAPAATSIASGPEPLHDAARRA